MSSWAQLELNVLVLIPLIPSASTSRTIIPGNSLFRLLTTSTRLTMTRNAVWALSNLCRGKSPPPEFDKVRRNALLAAR